MTERKWRQATKAEKCPACESEHWCQISHDGLVVCCMKGDGALLDGIAPERTTNKAGQPMFVYRLAAGDSGVAVPKIGSSTTRADADTLDLVYRRLVSELSHDLAATRRHLVGRGLAVEVVEQLLQQGVRELPQRNRYAIAKRLVNQGIERELAATPGFCIGEHDGRQFWTVAGYPGFLIPCRDLQGRIVGMQVRLSDETRKQKPDAPKYVWLSSKSRGGASPGSPCHVPQFNGDRSVVRVTEGVLKAEIATRLANMLTIGTAGTAISGVADIIRSIEPAEVRLAYDPEYASNPHIYAAVESLIQELLPLPVKLTVEVWELSAGKGIDDLLLAGGIPDQMTPEQFVERFEGIAAAAGKKHAKQPSIQWIQDVATHVIEALDDQPELLSTGLPELDKAMGGGISPGARVVIGGRPGHGKSALGQFVLAELAAGGQRCLFVSCEMTERQVGTRAVMRATSTHAEQWKLRRDAVLDDVRSEYDERRNYRLVTDVVRLPDIVDLIRHEHSSNGLDCVLVDYLQLVEAPGRTDFDKVSNTSRELTRLAKELGITLIMLAQLNRGIEKRGGTSKGDRPEYMPQLSDLRGSGQIEQDADVVVFGMYPCKLDDSQPRSKYVLKVAKSRDRDSNPMPFVVDFETARMRFRDPVTPERQPARYEAFDEFNNESF